MEDKRSKSIEEREEEYHKARERIFNQDVSFCGSMTGLVCDLETGVQFIFKLEGTATFI